MKTIVYLPATALAVDPGVEPSVGDVVDLQGTARVEMMQDGKARLIIEKLNGVEPESKPGAPGDGDGDEAGDDDETGDDALSAAAEAADREAYA